MGGCGYLCGQLANLASSLCPEPLAQAATSNSAALVPTASAQLAGVSQDKLTVNVAFAGIVTDLERPDMPDLYKRAKLRKATFTHLPGVSALIELAGLGRFLATVFHGLPSCLASLDDPVLCRLASLYKIGSAVSGTQLLRVASLAPQHRPLVLGIRTQVETLPYVVSKHLELVESLRLLFAFLITREAPPLVAQYPQFCSQVLRDAQDDSGHLILLASGILASLLSGRACLTVEGLFGAGKTTSVVLIFAWLVLTAPNAVKFTIASRENPAGQAVAKQVERLALPRHIRQRACSMKEIEDLGSGRSSIDWPTKECGPPLQQGRVLIATTGTIHDNLEGHPKEFGSHLEQSCIFVHEEGQQAIEYKSVPCLTCWWGMGCKICSDRN